MTDNTQKKPDEKAKVINLASERRRFEEKAKQAKAGSGSNSGFSSGSGFNLGFCLDDFKRKGGANRIGLIFQVLVFLLVIFFFFRECQG